MNTKTTALSEELFRLHPVWRWDDAQEFHLPALTRGNILPDDLGTLFIKAQLFTPNDRVFSGYVIGLVSIYAFGIFLDDKEFLFNSNLPEIMRMELQLLYDHLKTEAFPLFPMRYKTEFRYTDSDIIEGVFDLVN